MRVSDMRLEFTYLDLFTAVIALNLAFRTDLSVFFNLGNLVPDAASVGAKHLLQPNQSLSKLIEHDVDVRPSA